MLALQAGIALAAHKDGTVPLDPDSPGTRMLQLRLAARSGQEVGLPLAIAGSPVAREAALDLLVEDPDAYLKHHLAALEFERPKLGRVEHKVEGHLEHEHFVAVERREERPAKDVTPERPAPKAIDAKVVE
jgi:hypothetical protein